MGTVVKVANAQVTALGDTVNFASRHVRKLWPIQISFS